MLAPKFVTVPISARSSPLSSPALELNDFGNPNTSANSTSLSMPKLQPESFSFDNSPLDLGEEVLIYSASGEQVTNELVFGKDNNITSKSKKINSKISAKAENVEKEFSSLNDKKINKAPKVF